jgi:hypothetical protein
MAQSLRRVKRFEPREDGDATETTVALSPTERSVSWRSTRLTSLRNDHGELSESSLVAPTTPLLDAPVTRAPILPLPPALHTVQARAVALQAIPPPPLVPTSPCNVVTTLDVSVFGAPPPPPLEERALHSQDVMETPIPTTRRHYDPLLGRLTPPGLRNPVTRQRSGSWPPAVAPAASFASSSAATFHSFAHNDDDALANDSSSCEALSRGSSSSSKNDPLLLLDDSFDSILMRQAKDDSHRNLSPRPASPTMPLSDLVDRLTIANQRILQSREDSQPLLPSDGPFELPSSASRSSKHGGNVEDDDSEACASFFEDTDRPSWLFYSRKSLDRDQLLGSLSFSGHHREHWAATETSETTASSVVSPTGPVMPAAPISSQRPVLNVMEMTSLLRHINQAESMHTPICWEMVEQQLGHSFRLGRSENDAPPSRGPAEDRRALDYRWYENQASHHMRQARPIHRRCRVPRRRRSKPPTSTLSDEESNDDDDESPVPEEQTQRELYEMFLLGDDDDGGGVRQPRLRVDRTQSNSSDVVHGHFYRADVTPRRGTSLVDSGLHAATDATPEPWARGSLVREVWSSIYAPRGHRASKYAGQGRHGRQVESPFLASNQIRPVQYDDNSVEIPPRAITARTRSGLTADDVASHSNSASYSLNPSSQSAASSLTWCEGSSFEEISVQDDGSGGGGGLKQGDHVDCYYGEPSRGRRAEVEMEEVVVEETVEEITLGSSHGHPH